MRVGRLVSVFGVALLVSGLAVWGLSGSASAAPVSLFSSSTPGFVANAATVPAGICFVTIAADGGHGGASTGNAGGVAASVSARVGVTPGSVLSVLVGGAGADGVADEPGEGAGGQGGVGGGG